MEKGKASSSQRLGMALEKMIAEGEVPVGEKLPTELEL
jgi:DNA-binding FadR family transcriptional regulator